MAEPGDRPWWLQLRGSPPIREGDRRSYEQYWRAYRPVRILGDVLMVSLFGWLGLWALADAAWWHAAFFLTIATVLLGVVIWARRSWWSKKPPE